MKTQNPVKILIALVLCVTFPLSQAYSAVSDFNIPVKQINKLTVEDDHQELGHEATFFDNVGFTSPMVKAAANFIQNLDSFYGGGLEPAHSVSHNELPIVPVADDSKVTNPLADILDQENLDDLQMVSLTDESKEEDEEKAGGFITTRKVVVTTSLLVIAGLIIGLLAFAGGGGSGSSGGSSGGGGGGGSGSGGGGSSGGPDGFLPPIGGPFDTNNNEDGPGGEGERNGGGGDFGGELPTNPEPSTFLLLALGLLLPFINKRKS